MPEDTAKKESLLGQILQNAKQRSLTLPEAVQKCLQNLDEPTMGYLVALSQQPEPQTSTPPAKGGSENPITANMTIEQFVALAPNGSMRETLTRGLAADLQMRTQLADKVLANKQNKLDKTVLMGLPLVVLESMAGVAGGDSSGSSEPPTETVVDSLGRIVGRVPQGQPLYANYAGAAGPAPGGGQSLPAPVLVPPKWTRPQTSAAPSSA